MSVPTHAHGRRSLAPRAALLLAVPALALAIALGGCRAGGARNSSGGAPVSQSASPSSGASSNAALQRLENADSQNQSDQQQLNSASQNAGVDYSSQDTAIQP